MAFITKKAQGLTLNTMAIAVIVLIVIVITIAVFSGVVGDVVPGLKAQTECEAQHGVVKKSDDKQSASSDGCYAQGECAKFDGQAVFGLGCDARNKDKPYCCIKN